MNKKFLRLYLLFLFVSLSFLVFDGVSDIRLGNKMYGFLSLDFQNLFSRILLNEELKEENQILLEKIATLSYENQMYNELKKENEKLKKIVEFRFNYPEVIIPAEVQRRTSEEINLSFQISKGSSNGIETNYAVISFKGVVGKVLKSGSNNSLVQTLKNYNSAVSVRDTRSNIEGILKWNRKFFIEGIPQYADIQKGDTLVTSGKGSVFPKGLPVGIVNSARKKTNDYSLEIEVEPFENFNKVDVVFVIEK